MCIQSYKYWHPFSLPEQQNNSRLAHYPRKVEKLSIQMGVEAVNVGRSGAVSLGYIGLRQKCGWRELKGVRYGRV